MDNLETWDKYGDRKWGCFCECSPIRSAYKFLANLMGNYSLIVLVMTLGTAFVFTWIGIRDNGLPRFDDPYLGFQTRFTSISNRLTTLDNFDMELRRLRIIENYPGEKITEREFRRRRSSDTGNGDDIVNQEDDSTLSSNTCTVFPLEEYAKIAVKIDSSSGNGIFSEETLSLICYFQKLVEEIPSYSHLCEDDEEKRCCPVWSLPNYVAQWSNKTDCADIGKEDITEFQKNLNFCVNLHSNETMIEDCSFRRSSCPLQCHNGELLHTALTNSVDRSYLLNKEAKYSLITIPVAKTSIVQHEKESLQRAITKIHMPNRLVTLAGYDFGDKDTVFKNFLVLDLQFVAWASTIIFIVVCIYTQSIFVSVISFGALVLSLGVSYYIYSNIFLIPYFPFMNMLVTIIVLGIGTDGTLILSVCWQRAKSENHILGEFRDFLVYEALKECTATLIITTCTTAAAFLASLTSSIITIKCFSIFASTAIITSFVLIYVCVPSALVFGDLVWSSITSLVPYNYEDKDKFFDKMKKLYKKFNTYYDRHSRLFSVKWEAITTYKFVPKESHVKICTFLVLSAVLIWSCVVVFHFPQFQLPQSEQFQLLTHSHPVEKFEAEVKPRFVESGVNKDGLMSIFLIWGLKPTDNGFGLDPMDDGTLEFDPEFSFSTPESQKWMRKLCKKIQKQTFYDQISNSATGVNLDSCFMDTMVNWMKRDCEHFLIKNETLRPCCKSSKFPYEDSVFSKCVGLAARDVYRTPAFYFQPGKAGPKFFVLPNDRNATPKLATFTVRINTNVPFTLIHEKMDAFYQEVDNFFQEVMKNAPEGLQNGFFVSDHFNFFDLQKSLTGDTWQSVLLSVGCCFVLIWISSFSLPVALGAVIVILSTVIVSSALLIQFFYWKLGVFESIAVTVAVGLSDFTAHHSLEFSKRKSVNNMMSPTFFSALCTIIMGLFMMCFSSVLVYQQIGSFFFVLVTVSWLYSVFFLSPILIIFDAIVRALKMLFSLERAKIVNSNSDGNDLPTSCIYGIGRGCGSNSEHEPGTGQASTAPVPDPNLTDKSQSLMMEKWKLLKKIAQETTV